MDRAIFVEKIKSVADILGYKVEFYERSNGATLMKGKERIFICNDGYGVNDDRIGISGGYPRYCDNSFVYGTDSHKITVAASKTPTQIVNDLQRRFLPAYQTELAEVVEKVKSYNERMAEEIAMMKKAAELVDGAISSDDPYALNRGKIYFKKGKIDLHGKYGFEVTLQDLTYEELEAVIKAIQ